MTTSTPPARKATATVSAAPTKRLFTIDEYDRMLDAGILYDGEKVELIDGEILCMAAMGEPHMICIGNLMELFVRRLPRSASVRIQGPVRLPPHSQPEPDVAIVRGRVRDYLPHHPNPDEVLLAVEVAKTSLRYDRNVKLPLYAAAGIREVWIVDLKGSRIFVYRSPNGGRYEEQTTVARGGMLSPLAFPELSIAVDDVLP
ncbi:MAG: Uma2 family endonuclease [Dehalococcoidia bacterium]